MLTAKQKLFCEEYIIDFNATQAAIRAGYSEKTAGSVGSENLTKPEIQEYIKKLTSKRAERTKVSADDVVRELCKMSFVDADDFYCELTGEAIPHEELTPKAKACIAGYDYKSIKTGKDTYKLVKVIKFHSKEKAIELLGRHLSMFTDKVDVKGEFNLSSFVKALHDERS